MGMLHRAVRGAGALVTAALLAAIAACAPAESAPPPAPCAPGAEYVGPGAGDLERALAGAEPGDVLQLGDSVYTGRFVIDRSGAPDRPITLCGSREAVLRGGSTGDGYVLHLDGAAHWIVDGFSVTDGAKGVVLDGASHNVLADLEVTRTGDEAVHLRAGSSDNVVRDSRISETGLTQPEFGEGIYIGSAESNWCRYTDCEPDRSDRNEILGNTVSSTTAEAIDIKEGTTGGAVRGNTLSIDPAADVDSVIDIKGDEWVVEENVITVSAGAGIEVHSVLDPWGSRNRIVGNVFEMDVAAHAVVVARDALSRQNVIGCDNTVDGRVARTDPVCTP